ncbi:MAG: Spy/CpxP family protein refolding chaperone, partial [Reyranella sp.]|nr:Spy/CpxP family protein refolding chaperone [Reyranella sp.]
MIKLKFLTLAATVALVGTWPLVASAQSAKDGHHPPGAAGGQASPQTSPGAPPGMAGQPGMMGGSPMMKMMAMMKTMHGDDAPGMAMIDHIEGRIAFLRAELKITDAQAGAWDAFAAALRANAKALTAAREPMMGQMKTGQAAMSAGQSQAPMMPAQTLAQRLDAQERWQTARLEGTRAIKTAFVKLNEVLSPEQKTAADELLPPNMGMGM